jgi:hypothetical protein
LCFHGFIPFVGGLAKAQRPSFTTVIAQLYRDPAQLALICISRHCAKIGQAKIG